MNLLFHTLIGAGIGHVAASHIREFQNEVAQRPNGWVLGLAAAVSLVSHGVLDGLKHGYPLSSLVDMITSTALAVAWCLMVRRRFVALFAAVFFASFLPDLIDQGPGLLKSVAGINLHLSGWTPVFPWHWPDGSGSMYPNASMVAERFRILDLGRNRAISAVNHAIVVLVAAACIASNLSAFRWFSGRAPLKRPPTAW